MDPFIHFETVIDGTETAAAAPSEPAAGVAPGASTEPATPTGATEPAAAVFTPEQIQALRDSPEMQEWIGSESSTIAEARFAQLTEQARGQQQPAQQQPGGQVDINEFLDPMGENYGQNLLHVLGLMSQQQQQALQQALGPLQEQQEALQRAEQEENLKTMIGATVESIGLKGGDGAIARVQQAAERIFMAEALPLYGNTQRAAQFAIDKAARAEHAYQASIAGTSAAAAAENLAAINGAPGGVLGAGPGVVTTPETPLSPDEIVQKYSRLRAAQSA